jgi:collagenase-like PrtC family protease
MKFAVGYQLTEKGEEPFSDIVSDFKDHIEEIYFPWLNMPSGRAALTDRRGYADWKGQQQLEQDLKLFRDMGIKLDLLFNANCYGGKAVSVFLENRVCSVIDHLNDTAGGIDAVTTTSPAIAHTVRTHFPDIDVRASVNMRIGTVKGMEYIAHLFDSFYVQREYNRDIAHIKELLAWAEANGKNLFMLANSGCMNFCSGQTFHDNMVAHEQEIDETENTKGWIPHMCWNFLKERDNWVSVLENSWIRPEDLHHYDNLFPVVKLATRMHAYPAMVIKAYVEREFKGNLLDLFEPGYGPAFAPYIIDNTKFSEDWFEKTSSCSKACHECGYCKEVLDKVLVKVE